MTQCHRRPDREDSRQKTCAQECLTIYIDHVEDDFRTSDLSTGYNLHALLRW